MNEEDQSLYDEYLLAKLTEVNVRSNVEAAKESAKKELWTLWTAIDEVRREALATEVANEEMRLLCQFLKSTESSNEASKRVTKELKNLGLHLRAVIDALESKKHNLPVIGSHVELESVQSLLERQVPKLPSENHTTKEAMLEVLQKLHQSLQLSKENGTLGVQELQAIKSRVLKEESMKLSLEQIKDENGSLDTIIDSVIYVPPEPKLVDF